MTQNISNLQKQIEVGNQPSVKKTSRTSSNVSGKRMMYLEEEVHKQAKRIDELEKNAVSNTIALANMGDALAALITTYFSLTPTLSLCKELGVSVEHQSEPSILEVSLERLLAIHLSIWQSNAGLASQTGTPGQKPSL